VNVIVHNLSPWFLAIQDTYCVRVMSIVSLLDFFPTDVMVIILIE